MTIIAWIHNLITLWLSVYGLQAFILAALYLVHKHRRPSAPPVDRSNLPHVTVQIPVYNERHVVERALDHIAALDYPRDRLHIQVLDDSTDETSRLTCARAALHCARGLDIVALHRPDRNGFKAGALARGLQQTNSEYIAIFDADFCPRPDFLLQTIPHFINRPRLGMVQTRWTHLNLDYSLLTRAQALAFDGHFIVEQTGRCRGGLLMSFNGSGGVWRKRCIEESGGWQSDTLCEDLDLSYRAQLAGWECLYLPDVEVPAELPPQIAAFKQQQARWAQGSAQTLRKLFWPILRSRRLNVAQKAMALVHLSSYLAHALIVLMLLLSPFTLLVPAPIQSPLLQSLGLACLGLPLVYALSQQQLYPDWLRRLGALPLLVLIGIGIAWGNTQAVWRGLTQWGGTFARTPKFRIEGRTGCWTESDYRLKTNASIQGELFLTLYALGAAIAALAAGRHDMVPILLLDAAAFGAVAGLELVHVSPRLPIPRSTSAPATVHLLSRRENLKERARNDPTSMQRPPEHPVV